VRRGPGPSVHGVCVSRDMQGAQARRGEAATGEYT
jgi:hypothetical protein